MIKPGINDNPEEPKQPVEIGEPRLWNESMLGWWYDDKAGLFGFHRIGHLPNDNQAQIFQCILTHDGKRYRRNTILPFKAEWRTDCWRTEGLEAWFDEGWQVSYESPECTSRLSFEDVHQIVDTAKVSARVDATSSIEHEMFYHGHVEGGCRVSGTVMIDGKNYSIDCLGFRDHSWGGIRDISMVTSSRWVVGTCGEALSFGMSFCSTLDGEVMRNGWVHRDGKLHAIKTWDCTIAMDMDGYSFRNGEAWAQLDDDSIIELKTDDVWDSAIHNFDRWTTIETGTGVTVNGLRGVVNIESCNNPQLGGEVSAVPLRACASEGLTVRPEVVERP